MSRMPPPEITLNDEEYIDVAELRRRLQENNVLLIDVRDDSEIQKAGKIACARWINIPYDEIDAEFAKSDPDFKQKHGVDKPSPPGSEIVIQCRTGRKASHAFVALKGKGYVGMKSLKGGYNKWTEAA